MLARLLRALLGLILFLLTCSTIHGNYPYWFQYNEAAIKGSRVIVTGASIGIGRDVALRYARLGASVALVARTESKLIALAEECRQLGSPVAVALAFDFANDKEEDYRVLVQKAVDAMGGLDTLILNHVAPTEYIYMDDGWMANRDMEKARFLFQVNLYSHISMATHAVPHLAKTKGKISVIGSGSAITGLPKVSTYGATKRAQESFFESLRQDLLLDGIPVTVTLTTLGSIDTDAMKSATTSGRIEDVALFPATEAAKTIIRSVESRSWRTCYPYVQVGLARQLDYVWPEAMSAITRWVSVPKSRPWRA